MDKTERIQKHITSLFNRTIYIDDHCKQQVFFTLTDSKVEFHIAEVQIQEYIYVIIKEQKTHTDNKTLYRDLSYLFFPLRCASEIALPLIEKLYLEVFPSEDDYRRWINLQYTCYTGEKKSVTIQELFDRFLTTINPPSIPIVGISERPYLQAKEGKDTVTIKEVLACYNDVALNTKWNGEVSYLKACICLSNGDKIDVTESHVWFNFIYIRNSTFEYLLEYDEHTSIPLDLLDALSYLLVMKSRGHGKPSEILKDRTIDDISRELLEIYRGYLMANNEGAIVLPHVRFVPGRIRQGIPDDEQLLTDLDRLV